MSDSDQPREPHGLPVDLDSEADLLDGADDSPDILEGIAEDEPDLATLTLHDTPFRTPRPGERLSDEQLERDVDSQPGDTRQPE